MLAVKKLLSGLCDRFVGQVVCIDCGRVVKHYQDLPAKDRSFIVVYTGKRGVRDEIMSFLSDMGWEEGRHYIVAA